MFVGWLELSRTDFPSTVLVSVRLLEVLGEAGDVRACVNVHFDSAFERALVVTDRSGSDVEFFEGSFNLAPAVSDS